MLVFKKILCGALAVVMTTSSAFAVGKLSNDGSYAPKMLDDKYVYGDVDTKITWEPQSAEATQKEVEEFVKNLMAQEQAQKGSKLVNAAVHTVQKFHSESLYFFLGMGAVAFSQILFDKAQNPVGLEQHIQHSLSPMGMAGFAVFMYFNNLTSSTLETMMTNKAFMKYIPYLGMSGGFMAQSLFSHVAADPNIKACIFKKPVTEKDKLAGVDANPCGKAIENFSDLRLAPALTSMLLSTYLAGAGQNGLKWLAQRGKAEAMKFTGFDIILSITPGKWQVTGIRLLLLQGVGKVAQISAFVAIDAWLNRIVTYGWKNLFDGKDFWDIDNRIASRVKDLKSNNWNELIIKKEDPGLVPAPIADWLSEDRTLEDQLKYFQKRMADWRMTNLADVYEAHQNWNAALGQLIGNYRSSYEFYQNLIDRIRISRYKPDDMKPLKLLYPLSGVKAYNLPPERYDTMYTHPKLFETYQRQNLELVGKMLNPAALVFDFKDSEKVVYQKLGELLKSLNAKEAKKIQNFAQQIKIKDDKVLAKALYNLRMEQNPALRNPDAPYSKVILALIDILGAPSPQMEPGRGYLLAYQYAPSSERYVNGIDFSKGSSIFGTRLITDYYLMQMVCGPDAAAGESMVEDNLGYPSRFNPPMIRPAKHQFRDECIGRSAFMEPDTIYSYKFEQDGKKYRGFLDYVTENARVSIIGQKEGSNFNNWWSYYTTKQLQAAFDEYSVRYDEIVVKMMRGLYYQRAKGFADSVYETLNLNQNGKNTLNRGPIYNGTISAITQEERLYLAILEQLMNPERAYDFHIDQALNYKLTVPALQVIDKEIKKLIKLLKKISIVEKDGRERIESKLTSSDLTSQVEAVEAAITIVRQAMGMDERAKEIYAQIPNMKNNIVPGAEVQTLQQRVGYEASWAVRHAMARGEMTNKVMDEALPNTLGLNDVQKAAGKVALDSLSMLAAEIANYGNIAHAVSWDKIHDDSKNETNVFETPENVSKGLKNSGAATNPAGR